MTWQLHQTSTPLVKYAILIILHNSPLVLVMFKGSNTPVADTLSCNAICTLHCTEPPVVDLQVLAQAQTEDPEVHALQNSSSTSLCLTPLPFPVSPYSATPVYWCVSSFCAITTLPHFIEHSFTPRSKVNPAALYGTNFLAENEERHQGMDSYLVAICQLSKVQEDTITPLSTIFRCPIRTGAHRNCRTPPTLPWPGLFPHVN